MGTPNEQMTPASSLAVVQQHAGGTAIMSPSAVLDQMTQIQQIMKSVMRADTHYGVIPGTNKPTLYQPGAQVLGVAFGLVPRYTITREDLPNYHREYEVSCELSTRDGMFVGTGLGTASTLESRYRYRNAGRTCPACGKEGTIIKGKAQYGGGWVCFARKGGCGEKWKDGDKAIEGQHPGKVENPDPADVYNTVKKIAAKRAFVHAIIQATGCSDVFTLDLDEEHVREALESGASQVPPRKPRKPPQRKPAERNVTPPPPKKKAEPKPPPVEPPPEQGPATVSPQALTKIFAKATECGVSEEELGQFCRDQYDIQTRKDIPADEVDTVIAWILSHTGEVPDDELPM